MNIHNSPSKSLPPFDRDKQYLALVDAMRRLRPLALIGAGASAASGYPSWDELLARFGTELMRIARAQGRVLPPKLTRMIRRLQDPAWQAEEFCNHLGKVTFNQLVREIFGTRNNVEEPHHLIASLGFRHMLTTNFDPCIEIALKQAGRPSQRINWCKQSEVQQFFAHLSDAHAPTCVVYLHGHAEEPDNVVLTESAYARVYLGEDARRRLLALFITQPIVFIGFSMNDPDLGQLMREVLTSLGRPVGSFRGFSTATPVSRHFGIFGYRTADERDLIRRRMNGKYGLETVFYRIVQSPDGLGWSHINLLSLLESMAADLEITVHRGDPDPEPLRRRSKEPYEAVEAKASSLTKFAESDEDIDPYDLDPHKGRWGGAAEANGRLLRVDNIRGVRRNEYLTFDLIVEALPSAPPLNGKVRFHLHPTFETNDYEEKVVQGRAVTEVTAMGAFTVGVEADDKRTQLELDLSEDKRFPSWFRAR